MEDSKQIARKIFSETLAHIDIPYAFEQRVARSGMRLCVDDWGCELNLFSDVSVIALGKAAHGMLAGFATIFPDIPFRGVASAPTPPEHPLPNVSYFIGGHPLPNEQSVFAGQAALNLLQGATENSLVVFLLSGGGSALMEVPLSPAISLEDLRALNQLLVTCGASIDEINCVRKHLSAIKGGRLAAAAPDATKLTLAITDVPHGKESALASGPTIPDPTTSDDALHILDRYALRKMLPQSVRDWLGAAGMPETPKKDNPAFRNSYFSLLLTSHDLFHAAHRATEAEGFMTCCDNTTDEWPLDKSADFLLAQLDDLRRANPGQRVALISDGEVISRVTGQGIGGRNSAFVLGCVEKIAGQPVTILSAGTDGADGNSPAAGAVADGASLARASARGLSPNSFFARSDAFSFFSQLGDAIITGPTGNNLRDLRIFLAHP